MGDVDFVFGNATLVIDDSTLLSRADQAMYTAKANGRAQLVLA